jgi:hypothetical protein
VGNADVARGEKVGAFNVWPTARPTLTLERGERFLISLRIKPVAGSGATVALAPNAPGAYKLRREADAYWLDIEAEPNAGANPRTIPLVAKSSDGSSTDLGIQLTVNVPAENIVVTPRQLDLGNVSVASLKGGAQKIGRVGIRKLVGTFHIKSLSSTLAFLKLEPVAMVEGSNYLIRVGFITDKLPKAGAYSGVLQIETDEPASPRIEVPIKITLVAQ